MSILPSLLARALVATLAIGAVPAAVAKTPGD